MMMDFWKQKLSEPLLTFYKELRREENRFVNGRRNWKRLLNCFGILDRRLKLLLGWWAEQVGKDSESVSETFTILPYFDCTPWIEWIYLYTILTFLYPLHHEWNICVAIPNTSSPFRIQMNIRNISNLKYNLGIKVSGSWPEVKDPLLLRHRYISLTLGSILLSTSHAMLFNSLI